MIISWEDVVAETGAEMVGGKMYLCHVLLGEKRGVQFDFTPEGDEIARRLATKAAGTKAKFVPGLTDPGS